ncbi:Ltp family lipoprotein [uncultured Kocuria sp.]|uniref:Ltp family lipoprotein n=1 Tax=uncultured Kocuria sp. TaxID=259305 RepID=UPI002614D0F7|nr:Ltp family lipoprotein [uncultured Kocuria sp.]
MSHNPTNGPGPEGPRYNQQPGPYSPPEHGQEPPKKKGKKKWAIGCLGLFVLVIILFAGCSALLSGGADDSVPTPAETSSAPGPEETEDAPATEDDPSMSQPETTGAEPEAGDTEAPDAGQNADESSMTVAQQNAVRSAESYIDFSGFSRTGLIEQLEFEGYSNADATMAVDSLDIDYNEQAAKSAQSYLDVSGFSRSGLIEQLMFEGYTAEQAAYGADQVGL